jgi:hypothetical protein
MNPYSSWYFEIKNKQSLKNRHISLKLLCIIGILINLYFLIHLLLTAYNIRI